MDTKLRDSLRATLGHLIKFPSMADYRQPSAVLAYLEQSGYPLECLWTNIAANLHKVRKESQKQPDVAQRAYSEALGHLCKKKYSSAPDDAEKHKRLRQVLDLIDKAIINEHFDAHRLASLYCLRAIALAEWGEPRCATLALAAIERSLTLYPASLFLRYHKANILFQLDPASKAGNRLVQEIAAQLETDASALDGERELLGSGLFKLGFDLMRKSQADDVRTPLYDTDGDGQKSHNEKVADDGGMVEEAPPQPNEYDTPHEDTHKSFSFDYRLVLHPGTSTKGRYLSTNEVIESGELIFRERAYSLKLMEYGQYRRCHYCARDVADRFWPCHSCATTVYCGPTCAELNWRLSHQYECGFVDAIGAASKSTAHVFSLLCRVGLDGVLQAIAEQRQSAYDLVDYRDDEQLRLTREVDKSRDQLRTIYRAQMTLFHHQEEYDVRYIDHVMPNAIECAILGCISQGYQLGNNISRHHLTELIGHCLVGIRRVLTNVFRESYRPDGGEKVAIATCYQLLGSMFNHSCAPNLEWQLVSGYIYMTTTRAIKPGEELLVSYGPNRRADTLGARQLHLLEDYFFRCNCIACLDDARYVPALQCTLCPGPVLPHPRDSSLTSQCLMCGAQDSDPGDKFAQLESLLDFFLDGSYPSASSRKDRSRIMDKIEQLHSVIFGRSALQVQAIFVAARLLHEKGALRECLQLGSLIDSILPLEGDQLIALAYSPDDDDDEDGANDDRDEHKYPLASKYETGRAQHASIDHLAFWSTLFHDSIESRLTADLKVWGEMVRFYHRLAWLIDDVIERTETELRKLNNVESERGLQLRAEVNLLDTLKCFKQQEVDAIKRTMGHKFVQV